MYDINWARSVYIAFSKDWTRTILINRCIIQTAENAGCQIIDDRILKKTLVYTIQEKRFNNIWVLYKRLIKRSPLDVPLLQSLTTKIIQTTYYRRDAARQLGLFTT